MSFYDLQRISVLQQRIMAQSPSPKRNALLARISVLRDEYILFEEESRQFESQKQMNALAAAKHFDIRSDYHDSIIGSLECDVTFRRHEKN